MAITTKVKQLVPPILGQNFTMLGQVNLDYHASPTPGTTLEDVLTPTYWKAVSYMLKPGCEIRVIPQDNAWYARLLVISSDKISATVAVIYRSDLKQKTTVTADQFEVRSTQNGTKYGVFRTADGIAVKQGFATEKQAADYISMYVATMSEAA